MVHLTKSVRTMAVFTIHFFLEPVFYRPPTAPARLDTLCPQCHFFCSLSVCSSLTMKIPPYLGSYLQVAERFDDYSGLFSHIVYGVDRVLG